MMDRHDLERLELAPELTELDAELSSIRCEERPSFGPELEAELAREWTDLQGRRYLPVRELMAAAVAGLVLVGVGVPPARAALVRLVGTLGDFVAAVAAPERPDPVAAPTVELVPVDDRDLTGTVLAPGTRDVPLPVPGPSAGFRAPEATFPELLDRRLVETLIRGNYPVSFQRAGIGGTVRLLLWVDSAGAVDFVNLGRSSGLPELDRAALQVAPSLRFEPARRLGRAVGTWVEFDVRFEPAGGTSEEDWIPEARPVEAPATLDVSQPALRSEWWRRPGTPGPRTLSTAEFLTSAIGGDHVAERLGSVEAILEGEPPAGRTPTEWRRDVSEELEAAIVRSPENPAPFLALARLREKQGLHAEAQALLERGLRRARRSPEAMPPRFMADLYFELGTLVKNDWLNSMNRGRLRADALAPSVCPRAGSSEGAVSGYAAVERLIAWNYLCPEELGEILSRSFESLEREGASARAEMMGSFRSAVETWPAHVGANLEVLLGLAEEERWEDLLASAERFVGASQGDPHGLLLAGLALQRLSRSEEAERAFTRALRALAPDDAAQVEDVTPILLEPDASEYRHLPPRERAEWRRTFWGPLDPILATPVNERAIEHLARTSYAYLHFGSTDSDPAEVWVRYGRPDRIRGFDEEMGVRTEFWDFGPGPDLTFRRVAGSTTLELTPEGRAYLDEVRQLVPHRYGNASRTVFSLPAQIGRFRAVEPGSFEVVMHARVPLLLATGGEDSLAVTFALLDQEGRALAVTQSHQPALDGDIAMKATTRAGIAGVVVEVYNPRTGQAASLRRSTPPLASAGAVSMSDVVLSAPASPRREEVSRRGDWFEPLAVDRPVQSHAIGAYVELYGVGAVAPWYRIRVELQDRATGDVRDLPILPAGEEGFRTTWERRAGPDAVTPEFLSIWLGGVSEGRYVLRVVADVPEAGAPLVAEQQLDRR